MGRTGDDVRLRLHPVQNPADEIKGHRDYYNTECPGDRLYAKLPQLRTEVAKALAG